MFTKQRVLYLKSRYNDIINYIIQKKKNALPQDLLTHLVDGDGYSFSVEYLILAKIVSVRLESCIKGILSENLFPQHEPLKTKFTDLQNYLETKLEDDLLRDTVLCILKHSVPDGNPEHWKPLKGCPLNEAVCKLINNSKKDEASD